MLFEAGSSTEISVGEELMHSKGKALIACRINSEQRGFRANVAF
jgi:hypothetical protein